MYGLFFPAENLKSIVENALSFQTANFLDVVFRQFQFVKLGRRGVDLGLYGVQLDQHWASTSSTLQMKIHSVHENISGTKNQNPFSGVQNPNTGKGF